MKYSVAAGKAATLKLSLSKDGRSLLAGRRSVRVRVEVEPTGSAAVTRTVTLSK